MSKLTVGDFVLYYGHLKHGSLVRVSYYLRGIYGARVEVDTLKPGSNHMSAAEHNSMVDFMVDVAKYKGENAAPNFRCLNRIMDKWKPWTDMWELLK